jgi:hypothetical protein
MFTTTARVTWIAWLTVKFTVHASSIFFAMNAAFQGNWTECVMFASFAYMTLKGRTTWT